MDINELKQRFRHKNSADIKDVDIALKAVPFLVREYERFEKQIQEYEKRIDHLSELLNRKRPPLERKGEKSGAKWETRVDEETNRLYIKLSGKFNYKTAKLASNSILQIIPNLRDGFDVIDDVSEMDSDVNKRLMFHLKKVKYHLEQLDIARVIRIINPRSAALAGLFDAGAKEKGYQVYKVQTLKDAESILENVGRFLKA